MKSRERGLPERRTLRRGAGWLIEAGGLRRSEVSGKELFLEGASPRQLGQAQGELPRAGSESGDLDFRLLSTRDRHAIRQNAK